jgi:Tol biopolymer transport system component
VKDDEFQIDAQRWQRIQSLFEAALALAPEEREPLLNVRCSDDPFVRAEVAALLSSAVGGTGRIDDALHGAVRDWFGRVGAAVGDLAGLYRLTAVIGSGGMGTVFLAERADGQFERTVAVKMIRPESGNRAALLVRFRRERQILADLDHPNIARMLDGGVTDAGHPYLVMEYVDGQQIHEYCRDRKLGIEERVALFRTLCGAVEYAHRHGVIHRDIKPGNIFVTADGTPKLLDFGIARLVGNQAQCQESITETVEHMFTPRYASPEAIRGEATSEAADIYALGVLLYEMLALRHPFEAAAQSSFTLAERICSGNAPPPGTIGDGLLANLGAGRRRDMDAIVLKAMRIRIADRYTSVEMLSEDVQRYLAGLPVSARGASRRYLLAKLAHRHRKVLTFYAVAAAVPAWWLLSPHSPVPEAPLTPIPLTTYAGVLRHPALSLSGDKIAFAWQKEGESDRKIYVKSVATGELGTVVSEGDNDFPAWSPDGASIAFVRHRPDNPRTQLIVMPAAPGPERLVGEYDGEITGLSWSPNGSWLLTGRTQPDGIFAVSPATGEVRKLSTFSSASDVGARSPVVSPDSRALIFSRSFSARAEFVFQPLTREFAPGSPPRITSFPEGVGSLALSPDGETVVFSTGIATTLGQLWRIGLAGGPPRRLAGIDAGHEPSFSGPRGPNRLPRLAFVHLTRDSNIWRLTPGEKLHESVQVVASTRLDYEPRYSPDGKHIAFSSNRSGNTAVWVCNGDGSNPVQLTNLPSILTGGARWSPDGRTLVFVSNASGQGDIYIMSASGGTPVRLTNNPAHETAPSWSRDGKWIYFTSNRSGRFEVWKMPPDPNVAPVQVTRQGGYAAIESLDGKTLYHTFRQDRQGIAKMPVEGGPDTLVLSGLSNWGNFDVVGDGLIFIPTNGLSIQFYNFATGKIRTLAVLPRRADFGLSYSLVDGSILYSLQDQQSSELLMVENFR